jgi:RimJ/RimL family protein N-acetyltransferase
LRSEKPLDLALSSRIFDQTVDRIATDSSYPEFPVRFVIPAFLRHYRRFTGIDEGLFASGERIFACEQRNLPLCVHTRTPILATRHRDRVIFSIAPEYEADLRSWLKDRPFPDLSDDLLGEIDDFFLPRLPLHSVWRMLRLTTTRENLVVPDGVERAEVLTEAHREAFFRRMKGRGKLVRQTYWRRALPSIEEGRRFAVIEDGKMVADGHVSDIDWGGGNIAVGTDPEWQRKGYASAVVCRATEWCLDHDIVPVYWVDVRNEPSVKLAEKLGFTVQAEELVVRIVR